MDYVVGSVAALITGNVTPNRPRLLKRALTPTKHQPSPNVTPKSEFVEDRSIFLSPTMQKKKAVAKKSPKRIFENPDLENADSNEGNVSVTSPKADKVKKHLKVELEGDNANKSVTSQKSPKKKGNNKRELNVAEEINKSTSEQDVNESTPKKKKKKQNSESEATVNVNNQPASKVSTEPVTVLVKSPKKMKQRRKSVADIDSNKENDTSETVNEPESATNNNKSPNNQKNQVNKEAKEQPAGAVTGDTKSAKKKNKRRKKKSTASATVEKVDEKQASDEADNKENIVTENKVTKKKNRKRKKSKGPQNKVETDIKKQTIAETQNTNKEADSDGSDDEIESENVQINKKSKVAAVENTDEKQVSEEIDNKVSKKKNKKSKKSKCLQNKPEIMDTDEPTVETQDDIESETESKNTVNPNAITDKESDSEHESDDEIESENEEINKKVLEAEKPEESSEEEDEEEQKVEKKKVEKKEEGGVERITEEEIQRTLFVGNVPFTAKCKKEIKKIFSKHGQIETIRIRTVPIKDGSFTPKLALIKNELHPERTTVNVYIKYAQPDSVEKALVENNTVLNEHHLRVSRSSSTGAEHDPRCSVFIGNLPFAIEDETLRSKFEKCGEIHSVRIIRDKKTNAGKGFGYVNFESKDSVELALALTEEDLTIKNRILRVKRCTQVTNKKKPPPGNNQQRGGFRGNNNQGSQQRGGFRRDNNEGGQQRGGFRKDNQGNQRGGFRNNNNEGGQQRGGFRNDNNQGGQQRGGFRDNNQVNQQRSGFPSRNNQGNRQRNAFGNNQNQQRGGFNKFGNQRNQSQKDDDGREGAHRRVMNKRKYQDGAGGDGPPNKIQKDDQPKEKKSRKEFVGMTAEKKKKHKFDKGLKKKKALSEILTK